MSYSLFRLSEDIEYWYDIWLTHSVLTSISSSQYLGPRRLVKGQPDRAKVAGHDKAVTVTEEMLSIASRVSRRRPQQNETIYMLKGG